MEDPLRAQVEHAVMNERGSVSMVAYQNCCWRNDPGEPLPPIICVGVGCALVAPGS